MLRLTLFLILLVVSSVGARAVESAPDEFAALVDQMWQYRLEQDSLFATSVGEHRYNDRLPAVSRADSERRNAAQVAFLERLDQIHRDELSASNRNSYDILRRQITDDVAEFDFGSYLIPITHRDGFHIEFPELPKVVPLNTLADYENYLARLRAFGDYADGHIRLMREGIGAERILPAITLEGWQQSVDAQITDDPKKSVCCTSHLKNFPQRSRRANTNVCEQPPERRLPRASCLATVAFGNSW